MFGYFSIILYIQYFIHLDDFYFYIILKILFASVTMFCHLKCVIFDEIFMVTCEFNIYDEICDTIWLPMQIELLNYIMTAYSSLFCIFCVKNFIIIK